MSYQERRTIVSLISGILVLTAYCIYIFGRYQSGAVDMSNLKFLASTILTFVGIGILVSIVIQIIFHILSSIAIAVQTKMRDTQCDDKQIEKSIGAEMAEDEMDKLIELKAMRVGFVVAGIGFIAALLSLVLGYSAAVMLNILFLSFSGGALLEGATQLYFYRRGVTHA